MKKNREIGSREMNKPVDIISEWNRCEPMKHKMLDIKRYLLLVGSESIIANEKMWLTIFVYVGISNVHQISG